MDSLDYDDKHYQRRKTDLENDLYKTYNKMCIRDRYLIINAATESMLNRITFQDNKLRRTIGKEVIESYLYDIISQLGTVTVSYTHLDVYKRQQETP